MDNEESAHVPPYAGSPPPRSGSIAMGVANGNAPNHYQEDYFRLACAFDSLSNF
jgi:hypothetical protein